MRRYPISTTHKTLVVGVVLGVIGTIIVLAAWPSVEVGEGTYSVFLDEYVEGETEETGSWGVTVFGFILAGIGQFLIMVAAIAYGVRIGAPDND